jgi:hypothetical protein
MISERSALSTTKDELIRLALKYTKTKAYDGIRTFGYYNFKVEV